MGALFKQTKQMIFKKGDKVFDAAYGWGEVEESNDFDIIVDFKGLEKHYTSDGRIVINAEPCLSFTEYTLEGFSQERPLPFKIGDVVYLSDTKKSWLTCNLSEVRKESTLPFIWNGCFHTYPYLSLENPLKNPDAKIYTKEDL